MNWTDINNAITLYLEAAPVGAPQPPNLAAAIPVIINDAELRIYRDIDFLAFRGQNTSLITTGGQRNFPLTGATGQEIDGTPVAYEWPVLVESIALVVPSGETYSTGTLVILEPTSLDFIDMIWPKWSQTQAPGVAQGYFAMRDDQTAIIAPTPDTFYQAVVSGIWRPAPMSATNTTTWLGTYAADIFFSSCMIESEAFIRNWGAQSDDPRAAMSWETSYQKHWIGIVNEERRRKGLSPLPMETVPPSMSDQPR